MTDSLSRSSDLEPTDQVESPDDPSAPGGDDRVPLRTQPPHPSTAQQPVIGAATAGVLARGEDDTVGAVDDEDLEAKVRAATGLVSPSDQTDDVFDTEDEITDEHPLTVDVEESAADGASVANAAGVAAEIADATDEDEALVEAGQFFADEQPVDLAEAVDLDRSELDANVDDSDSDHDSDSDPEPDADADADADEQATPQQRLAARATTPEVGRLELRQIAGLTSGITMELEATRYDFTEDDNSIGFQIDVDENERATLIPGTASAKVDTIEVRRPTVIGSGVLDVGSARFLVRHRRERKRATDWLDQHDSVDRPEPLIEVPPNLSTTPAVAPDESRRWGRRRKRSAETEPKLDATSWELVERVRAVRTEVADRERYLHPDPAELAEQAQHRAPILGIRPQGHPLFAKVGVLVADMPWMPRFDNINGIPDSLGEHLKPLMSLPSLPIAADLLVGPLGIVGSRGATLACARHIVVSLFGLSTNDLTLHLATDPDREDDWEWGLDLFSADQVAVDEGFSVVVVDGATNFGATGVEHQDAIDRNVGMLILADSVEELPSYCGTVLQVNRAGSGLLTNHLGHIISGTPIGVTTDMADRIAADLYRLMQRRHSR